MLHTGDETALRELREIFETADLVKVRKNMNLHSMKQIAVCCKRRFCEHDKACSDAIAEAGCKNRDTGRNAAKKHTPDLLGNGPCLVAIKLELGCLFDC